jgi:hypothetical protein
MQPIRLVSHRYPDGFAEEASTPGMLVARGAPAQHVLDAANLEDPLFIRFVNCQSDASLRDFHDRFGDEDSVLVSDLARASKRMRGLITAGLHPGAPINFRHRFFSSAVAAVRLQPTLAFIDGRQRLTLQAIKVRDFMWMELATAVEVGAAVGACDQCGKLFLTGPHTGRRSHARFCADRCRVAAMRTRNANKDAGK